MSNNVELILMDGERINRSLKRIAHEIIEQNTEKRQILLFGIDDRGFAVAQKLAGLLAPIVDQSIHTVQLLLAEDKREQTVQRLKQVEMVSLYCVVVDDVIFSGETMFTALKLITDHRDVSEIHTTVLIDRGHRKLPIQAEFCGMELPTKMGEHVSVVVEDDNIKKVVLTNGQE